MPLDGERVSPYIKANGTIGVKPTVYDEAGMIVPDPTWVQHLKDVREGRFEASMPNDERHDRILPGAFGDEPKVLPIVVYDSDGTRRVIGVGTLTPNNVGFDLAGEITDPEFKKLVEPDTKGFGAIANPKFEKENPHGG